MKKLIVYKIIISIGLLLLAILPIIDQELYVSSTGKMEQPAILFVVLVIMGLFKNLKYLKEIVLILIIIGFSSSLFWIVTDAFSGDFRDIKIGFYINLLIFGLIITFLLRLKKIEK